MISASISESILPKIIFVGAIVAVAIFYGSVAIGADGIAFVEDSFRSNYSTHKDDFGQY